MKRIIISLSLGLILSVMFDILVSATSPLEGEGAPGVMHIVIESS